MAFPSQGHHWEWASSCQSPKSGWASQRAQARVVSKATNGQSGRGSISWVAPGSRALPTSQVIQPCPGQICRDSASQRDQPFFNSSLLPVCQALQLISLANGFDLKSNCPALPCPALPTCSLPQQNTLTHARATSATSTRLQGPCQLYQPPL